LVIGATPPEQHLAYSDQNIMKVALMSILSILAVLPSEVSAPGWMRWGEEVTISAPVEGDLYVAGGTVLINAPVNGDLIIVGGKVMINDSVSMDVLIAGGTVSINGPVADDIRCAGGNVDLSSSVGGDVILAGGELTVDPSSVIDGNVVISGGRITLGGRVKRDVRAMGGEFVCNGMVDGDLEARSETMTLDAPVHGNARIAAKSIGLGPGAKFHGDVRYWNENETLATSVVAGKQLVFDPTLSVPGGRWVYLGFTSAVMFFWYVGTALLMISIIQYFFSRTMLRAAGLALQESIKSLGFGFLLLVATPVAIIVSLITIVGVPVAIILAFAYITLLVLATVISSVVISNWLNRVYGGSNWSFVKIVAAAFGIFVFLKLATLTPVVGPLIMVLVTCIAIGSIVLSVLPGSTSVTTVNKQV
jgi:cytoskeletal protein CcmA (bactofilin family)